MTGEVGSRIVESKASYINNLADLNAMFLAFCKRLLGGAYEQRSVKTLGGTLKEVMEELFGVAEYDTMKIVLSNDNAHHNRPKFERLIAKAVSRYTERLRLRQAEARRRAFRHYDWVVPADRSYPADRYDEVTEVRGHALLPFMESEGAFSPERDFVKFLEDNSNAIEWWYKNGDHGKGNFAIGYTKSSGERALFYVDFIIRMKNGAVLLFDTKTKDSDTEAACKHNALWEYTRLPANASMQMKGGIIIQDEFGNWVYPPGTLDVNKGTSGIADWVIFDPQQYL